MLNNRAECNIVTTLGIIQYSVDVSYGADMHIRNTKWHKPRFESFIGAILLSVGPLTPSPPTDVVPIPYVFAFAEVGMILC